LEQKFRIASVVSRNPRFDTRDSMFGPSTGSGTFTSYNFWSRVTGDCSRRITVHCSLFTEKRAWAQQKNVQ